MLGNLGAGLGAVAARSAQRLSSLAVSSVNSAINTVNTLKNKKKDFWDKTFTVLGFGVTAAILANCCNGDAVNTDDLGKTTADKTTNNLLNNVVDKTGLTTDTASVNTDTTFVNIDTASVNDASAKVDTLFAKNFQANDSLTNQADSVSLQSAAVEQEVEANNLSSDVEASNVEITAPTEWNEDTGITKAQWNRLQSFWGGSDKYQEFYCKIDDSMLQAGGQFAGMTRDEVLFKYERMSSWNLPQHRETIAKLDAFFGCDEQITNDDVTKLSDVLGNGAIKDVEGKDCVVVTGRDVNCGEKAVLHSQTYDCGCDEEVVEKENQDIKTEEITFEEREGSSTTVYTKDDSFDLYKADNTGNTQLIGKGIPAEELKENMNTEDSEIIVRTNKETATGGVVSEGDSTETATGEAVNEGASTETATGEADGKGDSTETATGEAVSEGASTETATGGVVIEGDSTETATGEVVSEGASTETATGEAVSEGASTEIATGEVVSEGNSTETAAGEADGKGASTETATGEVVSEGNSTETAAGEADDKGDSTETATDEAATEVVNTEVVADSAEVETGTPAAGNVPERGGFENTGITEKQYNLMQTFFKDNFGEDAYDNYAARITDEMRAKGGIFEGLSVEQSMFSIKQMIAWSNDEHGKFAEEITSVVDYLKECDNSISMENATRIKEVIDSVNKNGTIDDVTGTSPVMVRYFTAGDCGEAGSYTTEQASSGVTNPGSDGFDRYYMRPPLNNSQEPIFEERAGTVTNVTEKTDDTFDVYKGNVYDGKEITGEKTKVASGVAASELEKNLKVNDMDLIVRSVKNR